jgi:hypothetical protein
MGRRRKWITRKLNTSVERFVLWVTPHRRLADIYDIIEDPPPAYALEMLFCAARAIHQELIEQLLFPAINIQCGLPDTAEIQRRFDEVVKASRWSLVLFVFAYCAYAPAAEEVLRRFVDIPSASGLILVVVLCIALPLQRRTLLPVLARSRPVEFESFADNPRKKLLRSRNNMLLADFKPSKSPVRAGAIALMILLVLFVAVYPLIRWWADRSLPPDLNREKTIGLFIAALVMILWFLVIWKSTRITVEAFDKEIKRLTL